MTKKQRQPRSVVNITVAIAVHPPKDGEEAPEVNVEVGQAGFNYGADEEEEDDGDGDDEEREGR